MGSRQFDWTKRCVASRQGIRDTENVSRKGVRDTQDVPTALMTFSAFLPAPSGVG
jgi:hypothetical protein